MVVSSKKLQVREEKSKAEDKAEEVGTIAKARNTVGLQ